MLQGQHSRRAGKQYWRGLRRGQFLQRHPVLTPVMLLSGSLVFGLVGFFSNSIFPVLALLGLSSTLLCFSIAAMLGIVSILIGIISVIEYLDRYSAQARTCSRPKEQGYANRH